MDPLLSFDLPSNDKSPSAFLSTKSIFRERFEREKKRRLAANRRALVRKEIEIEVLSQRISRLETRLSEKVERLQAATDEFSESQRIRPASVALIDQELKVWAPLQREICKIQITRVKMALIVVTRQLDMAIKERDFLKCHPLRVRKQYQEEEPT